MPQKPWKPCAHPGCPDLIRDGQYCAGHKAIHERAYDEQRGSAAKRGYDANWRKIRASFLKHNPLCCDPYGIHKHIGEVVSATDVDHKISLHCGGTNAWDNLQALCHSCHSRKTGTVDKRWGG